jgi:hypothetical protein
LLDPLRLPLLLTLLDIEVRDREELVLELVFETLSEEDPEQENISC